MLCVTQIICPFSVRAINQDMIGTNRSVTAISDHPDTVNVLTRQPPNSNSHASGWSRSGQGFREERVEPELHIWPGHNGAV